MSGTGLPVSYWARYLKKKDFSGYILLTNQISLSDCFYWNIGQYLYFNNLFSNFQRQKLTLGFTLINLSFSYMTKKIRTTI